MKSIEKEPSQLIFALADPDTELSQLLNEVLILAKSNPGILERINQDQDRLGKEKKKVRLQDKQWQEKQLTPFPEMPQSETVAIDSEALVLGLGKPRMQPLVVLLFIVLRAFLGGIKSKTTQLFILESTTIQNFLIKHDIKMPGWSTIIDNINAISLETLSELFNAQLRAALYEGLDDFTELTIDSTAVSGNITWPTDSGIISALVQRIWHCGNQLAKFSIPNMGERRFPNIIDTIKKCHHKISMLKGKKGDKARREKAYRKLLKEARKASLAFIKEASLIIHSFGKVDLKPSKKLQLFRIGELIIDDIKKLEQVVDYCDLRVNYYQSTKAVDKVMSLSDQDAAYIKKGNRNEVIGYKPQLGRSKNGFITSFHVPQGNTSDSSEFVPMVDQHIARTSAVPNIVSVDDGYASATGKKMVEKKGVAVVSISGAKGKMITPLEDWESDTFKKARADRSSVESLMFTIKYNYSFGRVMRREIEQVRAEMMEKVIVYNFSRIVEIRARKNKAIRMAVAS